MKLNFFFVLILSLFLFSLSSYSNPSKLSKNSSEYVGYCCSQKEQNCQGFEKEKVQNIIECQNSKQFYIDYGQCKLNCYLQK